MLYLYTAVPIASTSFKRVLAVPPTPIRLHVARGITSTTQLSCAISLDTSVPTPASFMSLLGTIPSFVQTGEETPFAERPSLQWRPVPDLDLSCRPECLGSSLGDCTVYWTAQKLERTYGRYRLTKCDIMVQPGVGNAKAHYATISPNGSAGRNPSRNDRELAREV